MQTTGELRHDIIHKPLEHNCHSTRNKTYKHGQHQHKNARRHALTHSSSHARQSTRAMRESLAGKDMCTVAKHNVWHSAYLVWYCGSNGTGNFENRVCTASAIPFRLRN